MKRKLLVSFIVLLILEGSYSTTCATTITSEVFGSDSPAYGYVDTSDPSSYEITNIDFTIRAFPSADNGDRIGDGRDEITEWNFDFSEDVNYTQFVSEYPSHTLSSAFLTITLIPNAALVTDDYLQIHSLDPIANLGLVWDGQFPSSNFQTIEIELLNHYSAEEIFTILFQNPSGLIPMEYADDSLLTYAKLEISNVIVSDVPILSGWGIVFLTLFLSLLGTVAIFKKKKLYIS